MPEFDRLAVQDSSVTAKLASFNNPAMKARGLNPKVQTVKLKEFGALGLGDPVAPLRDRCSEMLRILSAVCFVLVFSFVLVFVPTQICYSRYW